VKEVRLTIYAVNNQEEVSMRNFIPLVIVLAVFVLLFFVRKPKARPYMMVVYAALTVFFIVWAFTHRDQLYVSVFFAIMGLGLTLKNVKVFVPMVPVIFGALTVFYIVGAFMNRDYSLLTNIILVALSLLLTVQSMKEYRKLRELRASDSGAE
jgi:hypothetical protein